MTPTESATCRWLKTLILTFVMVHLNLPLGAVAPHPEALQAMREEGRLEAYRDFLHRAKSNGVCSPADHILRTPNMLRRTGELSVGSLGKTSLSTSARTVDTVQVLVVLVDFSDNPYHVAFSPYVSRVAADSAMFDSVLFSQGVYSPGSMTEYYLENSYGTFLIQGVIKGWYRMPRTYAQYVGAQHGLQPFSPNAQTLAADAIDSVSKYVDFRDFDRFGGPSGGSDGFVDGIFVVHAGTGYEESNIGGIDDIHSHKWQISPAKTVNGITISSYTMEPEESYFSQTISPIGVFCHEYGHFLGLPDLYDTDLTPEESDGLGKWSVMGSGNYLGNSRFPSHLDVWSKAFVGFLTPVDVIGNLRNVSFPQAEDSAVGYRLKSDVMPTGEYYMVENRQKTGFDFYLPKGGLLIYHVDQAANDIRNNNDNENRYLVALEQADGVNDLALTKGNSGDGGDPYPNEFASIEFTDLTNPSSKSNDSVTTEVAVWGISPSGPTMTANLDITYSRPNLSLLQAQLTDNGDGDNVIEEGEDFDVTFFISNIWGTGANTYVKLVSTNPQLILTTDSVFVGTMPGHGATTFSPTPFKFSVPSVITPRIDSLYFDFYSDNGLNLTRLGIEIEIGNPQVMIVNADQGGAHNQFYISDLYKLRLPHRRHIIKDDGLISNAELNTYPNVIWFFGDHTDVQPTAPMIQTIKSYLDNGGNLLLSGQDLVEDLQELDSAFLYNYLHAVAFGPVYQVIQKGVDGSPIADGIEQIRATGNEGARNWDWSNGNPFAMTPANDGVPAIRGRSDATPPDAYHGLTYKGDYRLAFFSLPFEAFFITTSSSATSRDVLLANIFDFFGDISTGIGDFDDPISVLPESFTLAQNYPNPFNPTTTISYTINNAGDSRGSRSETTELAIYNLLGQNVRQLVSRIDGPGDYTVEWDGADDYGEKVASGIYFYRLKRGELSQARKMVLLK